ncbi:hypothetical protein J3369_11185 [Alteromonas sp. NFXS44]|uniref:hypothetical protein n=1 Tax=Alteromonas sp. NFXS44 TaxID=2818435 RepID=UPI0032DE5E6D
MKTQMNINSFKVLAILLSVFILTVTFAFEEFKSWALYIVFFVGVGSFYIRRDRWFNKLEGNNTMNTSLGILFICGVSAYSTGSPEPINIGTSLTSALIMLSYVLSAYKKGNSAANSAELIKIDSWDVYCDIKTEVPTAMNGNIISETRVVNQVASNVTYEEALKLLKTLYADGKEPHAVSSRQYEALAPKMNQDGTFIGFQYDNAPKDSPFCFDSLNNKKK